MISSRTPEGTPNHCPLCGGEICVEPTRPPGDAPCPNCGTLLWFYRDASGARFFPSDEVDAIRERIISTICDNLGVKREAVRLDGPFHDIVVDSLDVVELVMELEEEFDIALPDAEAEQLKTIGDVIEYIVRCFLDRERNG